MPRFKVCGDKNSEKGRYIVIDGREHQVFAEIATSLGGPFVNYKGNRYRVFDNIIKGESTVFIPEVELKKFNK